MNVAWCIFGAFCAAVLFTLAAILSTAFHEGTRERFMRWENRWNHPEGMPWRGEEGTRWGPRWVWLCDFSDWLTKGYCHD